MMVGENLDRKISPAKRKQILERDHYRCQLCGVKGHELGGYTPLHVHHIEDYPDHCDPSDPANLITLCKLDHYLIHARMTRADVSTELSDEAAGERLERDYQILKLLEEDGLLRTKQIQTRIGRDPSLQTVKDRLWKLMGLDNRVPTQDRQIIDRDAVTGKWGLSTDINNSERGRIPDDKKELARRIEDERIRRALDRGLDRETVATSFAVTERTTYYKQHRAEAYGLPLDEINTRGRTPSRSPNDSPDPEPSNLTDHDPDSRSPNETVSGGDTGNNEDEPVTPSRTDDNNCTDESDGESLGTVDTPIELLDDTDHRRLLITVGIEDLDRDEIKRHCIKEGKSLNTVLEEQVEQFAEEVLD